MCLYNQGIAKGKTKMNKKQLRLDRLNAHYALLEKLGALCGATLPGKKLSTKLFLLEQRAHKEAENYCNLPDYADSWEKAEGEITASVLTLFPNLHGFFVNGDPRGYALKITEEVTKKYREAGVVLHTDWGGYGILSPEIDGN
jgi:hypothetical protein